MNSFHIILTLLILAFSAILFMVNAKNADAAERIDEEADELLENEIYQLMKAINSGNVSDEQRQARYRDIRQKYQDTFAVLGHEFPEYSSLKR
jgi:hypothetical protein